MKPLLFLSLTVNTVLVLGGAGFFLYQEGSRSGPQALAIAAASSSEPSDPRQATGSAAGQTRSSPFHWSELDAPDFPTYIARLRAIGCPEATIRDIVKGELDKAYEEKKQAAHQSERSRFHSERGSSTTGALSNADGSLASAAHDEQRKEQELAALLGVPSSPGSATQESLATAATPLTSPSVPPLQENPSSVTMRRIATPSLPLVYTADPAVGLSQPASTAAQSSVASSSAGASRAPVVDATQAPTLSELQQQFLNEIGGLDQDPSDPAYRERWLEAQKAADRQFRTFYGGQAYLQADVARAQQAAAASSASSSQQTAP